MKTNITPTSMIAGQGGFQLPDAPRPVTSRQAAEAKTPQAADLRLVIEEDEASGSIVYKTLDRRTGEVVRQLPREEVLRLREQPGYEPGEIADSRS